MEEVSLVWEMRHIAWRLVMRGNTEEAGFQVTSYRKVEQLIPPQLRRFRSKFAEFSAFTSHKQLNILLRMENEWRGKETEAAGRARTVPLSHRLIVKRTDVG